MFILSFFRKQAAVLAVVCGVVGAGALLAIGGCGSGGNNSDGNPSSTPSPGPTIGQDGWTIREGNRGIQPTRKWTYLVYMNAVNDLEEFAPLNIHQMEQAGSDDNVNIVVQCQRSSHYDTSNGNWNDARRYFITRQNDTSNINSPLMSQKSSDDIDMGNASEMRAFIDWGVATFPAQKYCLVIWNHGAGWRKARIKPSSGRGVSYNYDTDTHIDTIEMPGAIAMPGGRKWDLLAYDSSLMQMAEVNYEVRNQARYIVGSEESPPGAGYPYDVFLKQLAANPDMEPTTLGFNMAQAAGDKYGRQTSPGITQSVIDASKLDALAPALDNLGAQLSRVKNIYGPQIISARNSADYYEYPYTENKDLLDFLHYLVDPPTGSTVSPIPDAGVQSAVSNLRGLLGTTILKNINSEEHSGSNGLALFIPSPLEYTQIDRAQADGFGQRYSLLSLTKAAPNWQSFLVNGPQ